jgi:phosphate transport system substrate-binding protein
VKIQRFGVSAAFVLAGALALSACGGQQAESGGEATGTDGAAALSGSIASDGSSTVGPLTSGRGRAVHGREQRRADHRRHLRHRWWVQEVLRGPDPAISNASRPIKDEEKAACEANGIEYQELIVANDALTVVVNKENTFFKCLTVEELNTLWEPRGHRQGHDLEPGQPGRFPAENRSSSTVPAPTRAPSTTSPTRSTVRRVPRAPTTSPPRTTTSSSRVCRATRTPSATSASPTSRRTPTSSTRVEIDGGQGCVAPSSDDRARRVLRPAVPPAVHLRRQEGLRGDRRR